MSSSSLIQQGFPGFQVTQEIVRRLTGTFMRDANERRAIYGGTNTFHDNPLSRDLILYYEYFRGGNGARPGASHQTGWTGETTSQARHRRSLRDELVRSYACPAPVSIAIPDQG